MYLLLYQTLSNWNIRSMPYSPEHMAYSTVSYTHVKTAQCLTLCNPIGYTVNEILQARILEWVAYPFSSKSSWPRNQTGVSYRFFANWAIREALIYTEMFNNVCGDQFNEDSSTVTQLIFELVWVHGQWSKTDLERLLLLSLTCTCIFLWNFCTLLRFFPGWKRTKDCFQ